MPVHRLAILGTGLIGASIGLAAKRAGVATVIGWDIDPEAAAVAAERGAVDTTTATLAEALADADLAVVAAPVGSLPAQVAAVLADSGEQTTVTDVGSTKAAVCAAAAASARFIGGHPMAGGEARGPAHAKAELFEGATWFLTPTATTPPERYRLLHGFVGDLGAVPVAVDPASHDRLVALTSHLPHALANLLVNQAGATRIEGHEPLAAAGGSLRDMTRVAGSNQRLWTEIFLQNRDAVLESLREHRRLVEELEGALATGDAGFLAGWIGEAFANRRRMLERAFADPGSLQRLVVHLPDRPGAFAAITQALGAERINIEDLEMHHHSVERGGELELMIAGEEEAARAAEIVRRQGFDAVVSPVLDA